MREPTSSSNPIPASLRSGGQILVRIQCCEMISRCNQIWNIYNSSYSVHALQISNYNNKSKNHPIKDHFNMHKPVLLHIFPLFINLCTCIYVVAMLKSTFLLLFPFFYGNIYWPCYHISIPLFKRKITLFHSEP